MRLTCKPLAWIFPLLILISCSPRSEESGHSFRIHEENGITIAETTGGPKYEGELFRYEKVQELKEDPDQPESLLYSPGRVLIGDDGCFYVQDSSDKQIVVYNPDLTYSHRIGRAGRGPGEFVFPLPLWVRGGKIAVAAGSSLPTYIFSTYGDLLEILTDHRLQHNDYIIPTFGEGYLVRGIYPEFNSDEGYDNQNDRITCFDSGGDTLGVAETGWVVIRRYEEDGVSGNIVEAYMYFAPTPQSVVTPYHGIYCTTGAIPEIQQFSLEGNLEKIIRIDLEAMPVTAADRDSALAGQRRRIREEEDPNRRLRYQMSLDHSWFPPVKAFWHEMSVDEAGFIWLRLPHGQVFQIPPDLRFRWLVLNPKGELLGETRWPAVMPYRGNLSRGFLIGYQEDEETGERHCFIYRIRPAVEELKYP